MRDDILQCIKLPGIKESQRARHSDGEGILRMALRLDSKVFEGERKKQNICSSIVILVDLWRRILPKFECLSRNSTGCTYTVIGREQGCDSRQEATTDLVIHRIILLPFIGLSPQSSARDCTHGNENEKEDGTKMEQLACQALV